MSAPIPLRRDFDASQLHSLARRTNNGSQVRRLLALAAIYDGATRTEAAKIGGIGLQIIRDWVLRFNARGPDALLNGNPYPLAVVAADLKAVGAPTPITFIHSNAAVMAPLVPANVAIEQQAMNLHNPVDSLVIGRF